MVREEVLLAIPDAPLCRDDCPGLCPVCGVDLESSPDHGHPEERDERWSVLARSAWVVAACCWLITTVDSSGGVQRAQLQR